MTFHLENSSDLAVESALLKSHENVVWESSNLRWGVSAWGQDDEKERIQKVWTLGGYKPYQNPLRGYSPFHLPSIFKGFTIVPLLLLQNKSFQPWWLKTRTIIYFAQESTTCVGLDRNKSSPLHVASARKVCWGSFRWLVHMLGNLVLSYELEVQWELWARALVPLQSNFSTGCLGFLTTWWLYQGSKAEVSGIFMS